MIFASVVMLVTGYFGEAVYTTGAGPAAWELFRCLLYILYGMGWRCF